MSSTQVSTKHQQVPTAATVDLKLEVVNIPVSDVERSSVYTWAWGGGRRDSPRPDWRSSNDPSGSPCSIPSRAHARPVPSRTLSVVHGAARGSSSLAARRREPFHLQHRRITPSRPPPENAST